MRTLLLMTLALLAGGLIPVQGAVNSKLAKVVNHPLQASLVSFVGALIILVIALIALRPPAPTMEAVRTTPWYAYTGGVYGLIFVTTVLILVPLIGVANTLAAALAGQLIVSVVMDHYGVLGVPVHTVSWPRVAGVACLLVGLMLVKR